MHREPRSADGFLHPTTEKRKRNIQAGLHLLAITLLLFGLGWTAVSSLTFFSNDIGLRFLQIRWLIAQDWQSFAIPYPAETIDPDLQYVPYYYAYSVVNGSHACAGTSCLLLNITPFFPYLAALLYKTLGTVGLVLSPIIGSVLTAWGSYKLARLSKLPRPFLLMWTAVFGTPLLFYSLQLWDHSLATGLAVLGSAWVIGGKVRNTEFRREPQSDTEKEKRGKLVETAVGGILLGLALGQRPEMYLFVAALGVAWLIVTRFDRKLTAALLGGGLLGALPIWILQWRWVGHPLGMALATHLLGYGRPDSYPVESYSEVTITPAIKIGRLLFHIESRDPLTFMAALAVLIGVVLLVFALRVPRYQKTAVLWSGTLLTIAEFAIWATVAWQEAITGLVSTFPLLGISVAFVDKKDDDAETHLVYRFVLITIGLFVLSMLLFWPSFGGTQWGARYLLPAYPLLLYLAFYGAAAHGNGKRVLQKSIQLAFMLLLVVSVGLQFVGIRHLETAVTEMVPVKNQMNNFTASTVITNHPFLPSFMSGVEGKQFFYVSSDEQLETLIQKLFSQGIRRIAFVPLESDQIIIPSQINNISIIPTGISEYELNAK